MIKKIKIQAIILLIAYFLCFFIVSSPIRTNPYPYGGVDGGTYAKFGDYTGMYDKSIYRLPTYFGRQELNNGIPWHAPVYYMLMGLSEIAGGERFFSMFLFIALTNTLIFFSIYLLIKKLYGFYPAVITAVLVTLSARSFSFSMMGQWQHLAAASITPLVIYCIYKYYTSYNQGLNDRKYIFLVPFLVSIQFLLHTLFFLHSVFFVSVYTILAYIKNKKIPFSLKDAVLSSLIFILLVSSFLQFSMGVSFSTATIGTVKPFQPSMLLWGLRSENYDSIFPEFFSFKHNNYGYWMALPIIAGILLLLLRRNDKDITLLSWLLSFYLMINVFPFLGMLSQYAHKSFIAESFVLYPFAVIAFFYLPSMIPMSKKLKYAAKIALVSILVLLVLFINVKGAYKTASSDQPISRVTGPEYAASEWLRTEQKNNSYRVALTGTVVYGKKRMLGTVANKLFVYGSNLVPTDELKEQEIRYVYVDYSDLIAIQNQQAIEALVLWEKTYLSNTTLVYNKDNVKIYDLGENRALLKNEQ